MAPKFFVGVDISKVTLDLAVIAGDGPYRSFKIENNEEGIKDFLILLKDYYNFRNRDILFCAENVGIYARFLIDVLSQKHLPICMESPLHIKRSLGIQRGKNDKLDAIRIAQYLKKNFHDLKFWERPRECIERLKTLSTIRRRLIKIRTMLTMGEKNNLYYLTKKELQSINELYSGSLEAIRKDVSGIEAEMHAVVKSDEKLQNLLKLVTSVPQIGITTAIQIIIHTNEFRDFTDPKKFASYCGVAPFDYSSGTSIKGRTKVSYLANKEIKSLLHMAAIGYIRHKKYSLGKYYAKKIAEGKHRMSVLNAIRNKLIVRIFACVKNNSTYVDA